MRCLLDAHELRLRESLTPLLVLAKFQKRLRLHLWLPSPLGGRQACLQFIISHSNAFVSISQWRSFLGHTLRQRSKRLQSSVLQHAQRTLWLHLLPGDEQGAKKTSGALFQFQTFTCFSQNKNLLFLQFISFEMHSFSDQVFFCFVFCTCILLRSIIPCIQGQEMLKQPFAEMHKEYGPFNQNFFQLCYFSFIYVSSFKLFIFQQWKRKVERIKPASF